jgi:hypothetical protein
MKLKDLINKAAGFFSEDLTGEATMCRMLAELHEMQADVAGSQNFAFSIEVRLGERITAVFYVMSDEGESKFLKIVDSIMLATDEDQETRCIKFAKFRAIFDHFTRVEQLNERMKNHGIAD